MHEAGGAAREHAIRAEIAELAARGEHDPGAREERPDRDRHLKAVDAGKTDVKQDQLGFRIDDQVPSALSPLAASATTSKPSVSSSQRALARNEA